MLQLIKQLLLLGVEDIDSGKCQLKPEQLHEIVAGLSAMFNPRISKRQVCDMLGISPSTLDNYIKMGVYPKGTKQDGFKELSWSPYDFIINPS